MQAVTQAFVDVVEAELDVARRSLADLRGDLASIAESTALVPDDEHDAEGATVGYERARVGALVDVTQRRISELETALDRARSGEYRGCEACHGDIGAERLEALPATRLCVRCARLG